MREIFQEHAYLRMCHRIIRVTKVSEERVIYVNE